MSNNIINQLQKSGAITIKKIPNVILMCTIKYPPLEGWDFGEN